MRDLKQNQTGKTRTGKTKIRPNRKRQKKQPVSLRKMLHRTLRIGVVTFSGCLVVVGAVLLLQVLLGSDLFKIDSITVEGGWQLSHEQVIALSDIKTGTNTFALDLNLIGRKISENPWVREARVDRIFPRQVVIRVEERLPKAIINLGYLYYLDESGEVFKLLGQGDKLDFPVVTGFDRQDLLDANMESGRKLKQIVALIDNLKSRQEFDLEQVSEIRREKDGSLNLFTCKGAVRIQLGRDEYVKKLDRLERIYAKLKPRLPVLDYIDLNVDERIIVRIERQSAQASG